MPAPGRAGKIALLTSLYFCQGLPFGYFTQAIPVMLRAQGLSLEKIGLASLVALPWAFKFVWAPFVDRTSARGRRAWILPLQAATVLLMIAVSSVPPSAGTLLILVVAMLASNTLAATQDIPTDALAIDLLSAEERGLGNGVQVGAYRLGMIVGGGAILAVYDALGWRGACLVIAGLLAAASVPVWIWDEPPHVSIGEPPRYFEALKRLVARPGIAPWLAVLVIYKAGESLGGSVVKLFLVDQRWDIGDIGLLLGIGGSAAGLTGAMIGGMLVHHLGRRASLVAFGAVQALAVGLWAVPAAGIGGTGAVIAVALFEPLASGAATAALFTAMMDVCEPRTAATDYTLQASVVVFATIIAATVAGASAHGLGYGVHFAVAGAVCLVAMGLAAVAPAVAEPA